MKSIFGIALGVSSIILGIISFSTTSPLLCFFGGFIITTVIIENRKISK